MTPTINRIAMTEETNGEEEDLREEMELEVPEDMELDVPESVLGVLAEVIEEDEEEVPPTYELKVEDTEIHPVNKLEEGEREEDEGDFADFDQYIQQNESIAGEYHHIDIELRNTGEDDFPGGQTDQLYILTADERYEYDDVFDFPSMEAGEVKEVSIHLYIALEGYLTLYLEVIADDGKGVEIEPERGEPNEIVMGSRSVSREDLITIGLLNEIKEALRNEF